MILSLQFSGRKEGSVAKTPENTALSGARPRGKACATPNIGYRSRIRQIVRELEGELRNEVLRAEGRIRRGEAVDRILLRRSQSLSPLGCFIVARRAGRTDLADHFRAEAIGQHRSCPLYRQATILRLLPPGDYPVAESWADGTTSPTERLGRSQAHLN